MFKFFATVFLDMFREPSFAHGERVNRFHNGALDRTDGHVLTQSSRGVLVEWPRAGQQWENPGHLCVQAG